MTNNSIAPPGGDEALSRLARVLGLRSDEEALLCMPGSYIDCTDPADVASATEEELPRTWRLRLAGTALGYSKAAGPRPKVQYQYGPHGASGSPWRLGRLVVNTYDLDHQLVEVSFFNANPRVAQFAWAFEPSAGEEIWLHGTLRKFGRTWALTRAVVVPPQYRGRVWVRYSGIPGKLAGEHVESAICAALASEDAFDRALRASAHRIVAETGLAEADLLEQADAENTFENLDRLLGALHAPQSMREAVHAAEVCRRIAALSVQAAALRNNTRLAHPMAPIAVRQSDLDALVESQSETLTADQLRVIGELGRCLASPAPLVGLLSADVATGKTLTFAIPAAAAHQQGARVAILAPTLLLADQIAQQIFRRFDALGVRVERVEAGSKIRDPSAILVGTTGLITAARKQHYKPNFVICDEQHKLSAAARDGLLHPFTHLLEVTATPIPRSMASAMYGGMRLFTMRTSPVAKDIRSHVADAKNKRDILRAASLAVMAGGRVAFVYPAISQADASAEVNDAPGDEESAADPAAPAAKTRSAIGAVEAAKALERPFGAGRVGVLHGQLPDTEKTAALERFRRGETPVLVATTVIETGIDVPDIRALIVRDADRFGIAQLHQLRGRLARNGGRGEFFMMVESLETLTPETLERLHGVAATTDGFALAEMDLLQRGHGDLDGITQTGDHDAVFKLTKLAPADYLARIAPEKKLTLQEYGGASFRRSVVSESREQVEQIRLI